MSQFFKIIRTFSKVPKKYTESEPNLQFPQPYKYFLIIASSNFIGNYLRKLYLYYAFFCFFWYLIASLWTCNM